MANERKETKGKKGNERELVTEIQKNKLIKKEGEIIDNIKENKI